MVENGRLISHASYELDLSVPFDRATAWVLVGLAWSEPGNFFHIIHTCPLLTNRIVLSHSLPPPFPHYLSQASSLKYIGAEAELCGWHQGLHRRGSNNHGQKARPLRAGSGSRPDVGRPAAARMLHRRRRHRRTPSVC